MKVNSHTNTNPAYVCGLMSGTSLDGVDIAICSFQKSKSVWKYKIHFSKTIPYPKQWKTKLSCAHHLSGRELVSLDREYGAYLGRLVNETITRSGFQPFLIASHGHTIFHSPDKHFTLQIGCGADIAEKTGITTICDFRSTDVAAGGQGAPLVPIGDKLLFSEFDACLNLGGFANISFEREGQRIAFDICPVNIILNRFAAERNLEYDENGELAKSGNVDAGLLKHLNSIKFYQQLHPKSLGREWIETEFDPAIRGAMCSFEDKIRTCYEHIITQICTIFNENKLSNVLITGGGAHNVLLIELMRKRTVSNLIIPDMETVDFKEALIFAFMGVLRYNGEVNCLASVTGASHDSCCGTIYL